MDLEVIRAHLRERAAADQFSGVIQVDHAGETVLAEAFGMASRAWQVPCRLQTRFDTASITKLFTAVAVLQQIEAGRFALGTPAIDYLALSDTAISPLVTPYHLLTHTSGIADDAEEEDGEAYESLFEKKANYTIRNTVDFLPQFANKAANFAPGQGCRYCNCSYVLLGLMVEKASGLSYRDYVTRHVFGPAGMTRSGFFRMDRIEPDVAEGADPIVDEVGNLCGWRRNIYSYPPIGSPDGGAYVTAADMVEFHRALTSAQLINPEFTAAMLTPKEDYRATEAGKHRTGFGFEFEVDGAGRVLSYWKEGINVGVSGMLRHYPREDLTMVLLSNREQGAWETIALVDQSMKAAEEV